jgi:hypothetical protein
VALGLWWEIHCECRFVGGGWGDELVLNRHLPNSARLRFPPLSRRMFLFPLHILRRKYALPHCVPPRQKEAGSLRQG